MYIPSAPLRAVVANLVFGTFVGLLPAQLDRYEVGLRLRAYEQRLAACDDQERRVASLGELERAVQSFFRLDLGGVAAELDAADRWLHGAPPEAAETWARSLQFVVDARLSDPSSG